jgi:hypothetical protein
MQIQSTAHDPVRLHIQAHNALSMALRQLSQPGSSAIGAVGYAQKAMEALRKLAQAEGVEVRA